MSVLEINKGINRPMVFKGFKAQYITYLGIGLVSCLLLFVILYMIGVHVYLTLGIILPSATAFFVYLQKLSTTHGEHGLLKHTANKRLPHSLNCQSAHLFKQLTNQHENKKTGTGIPDHEGRK